MIIAIIISLILGFVLGYAVAYGLGAFKTKIQEDEVIVKKAVIDEFETMKARIKKKL